MAQRNERKKGKNAESENVFSIQSHIQAKIYLIGKEILPISKRRALPTGNIIFPDSFRSGAMEHETVTGAA